MLRHSGETMATSHTVSSTVVSILVLSALFAEYSDKQAASKQQASMHMITIWFSHAVKVDMILVCTYSVYTIYIWYITIMG